MTLHKDKFEYMCHSYNKSNYLTDLPFISEYYEYTVSSNITLSPVHRLRDLGVTVSSNLSWSPHIKTISDKARQKAAWVLSVFHTRSREVMLTLYKSMVRSLLEYCCPLWNPVKVSDIQELESVQKVFTSRICGMKDLHYWDRLKQLSLMSLQRRRERYIVPHVCGRFFTIVPVMICKSSSTTSLDSDINPKSQVSTERVQQRTRPCMIPHLQSWVLNYGTVSRSI